MRHSRSESGMIKSCAASHGVSERAVREWRRRDDPRWKTWLVKSAKSATQLDAFAETTEAVTDPSTEAEAARRRFVALSKMLDSATARGEVAGLPVLLRAAQEAQRLLQGCRTAEAEWLEQTRRQIPVKEVREFKDRFLFPLFEILKSLPLEAAESANPERPDIAREALEHWLRSRFRPHFEELKSAVQKIQEPQ
jgi:hypothetical protein